MSPNGSVKREYSFLTALVQAWRFKIPSKKATKLIIPPTTVAFILSIAKPCIICCQRTTRTCWASRERVECRRQDPSNFVAATLRYPMDRLPLCRRSGGSRDGNLAEGGKRNPRAHWLQINLVVLDECCAVVCRNRTAFKLSAEFHMLTAFRGTGKTYDMDMQAIARHMTGTCKLMMQFRTRQDTLGNELVYT